jgi:hypothetical protein
MKARATALVPFVPSGSDFEAALAYLADLALKTAWRTAGSAGLKFGAAHFMLQEIHVPVWQVHIIDPAGVCWHFRRGGAA